MKIEIGETRPEQFKEDWPGQYSIFSYMEFACGVPSPLFLITTRKENGKPNVCLYAWSSFSGDGGGYFAILTALMQGTHTYRNILRDKEFCINFIDASYYDHCMETIRQNSEDTDEFAVGGFTAEPSVLVKPPRIREAFLSYECTLESCADLSGKGQTAMVVGRVRHAAVAESHHGIEAFCTNGFMFNIHSPKDPKNGVGEQSAVATLTVQKITL